MARNIESPGVQINEIDLSFNTSLPIGTNILVHGFAPQGPTLELVNVTSKSELEQIYGSPTTEAERYFYNSCGEILNSQANLIVNRLPYGDGTGAGFGDKYTGLFFPVTGFESSPDGSPTINVYTNSATENILTGINLVTQNEFFASAIPNITSEYSIQNVDTLVLTLSTQNHGVINFKTAYQISPNFYKLSSNLNLSDPDYGNGEINVVDGSYNLTIPNVNTGSAIISATYHQRVLSGVVSEQKASYDFSNKFLIGEPTLIILSETEYIDIQSGQIAWSTDGHLLGKGPASPSALGNCGFIVLNKSKVSTDDISQGYYLSIIDSHSVDVNGSPQYDSIKKVNSVNRNLPSGWFNLSQDILGNYLTGSITENPNSISEVMESGYQYDFSLPSYNDSLIIGLFRLRTSNSSQNENKLYLSYTEKYVGSLDENDIERVNPRSLQQESFFLGKTMNEASNFIDIVVNPNIAKKGNWVQGGTGRIGYVEVAENAKAAYSLGQFISTRGKDDNKIVGNVPLKLEKALMLAENKDLVDVDVVVEAGLGTVYSYAYLANPQDPQGFDPYMSIRTHIEDLKDQDSGLSSPAAQSYLAVHGRLQNFVAETRKDCMLISDPLRGIFVQGENFKVIQDKNRNFSQDIYWPLKNLYGSANSNYVASYANWVKAFDAASGQFAWMPFSGYQASIIARMDTNTQPWFAPAGLENGIVRNIVDIAINPTQKQRDLLYKIGLNPVVYFPRDAYTVWGQKTLQAKPSAFDRINVRRLFLTLEKATLRLTRYFVMQPNTVFTRTRLVNYLKPIFDIAKQNEGVYDYLLVCDERNNTPDVIDRNELVLDIYIKPVRTAEFILVNFIATRTGADFNELIR
jgi:hypothetical protein